MTNSKTKVAENRATFSLLQKSYVEAEFGKLAYLLNESDINKVKGLLMEAFDEGFNNGNVDSYASSCIVKDTENWIKLRLKQNALASYDEYLMAKLLESVKETYCHGINARQMAGIKDPSQKVANNDPWLIKFRLEAKVITMKILGNFSFNAACLIKVLNLELGKHKGEKIILDYLRIYQYEARNLAGLTKSISNTYDYVVDIKVRNIIDKIDYLETMLGFSSTPKTFSQRWDDVGEIIETRNTIREISNDLRAIAAKAIN